MKYFTTPIKTALDMYRHRDQYAYFYGCKGSVLTDAGVVK